MKHVDVKSGQVQSVAYNKEKKIMEVMFNGGAKYQYHGVSPMDHLSLMTADSISKHLAEHVKGKFKFEKVGKK